MRISNGIKYLLRRSIFPILTLIGLLSLILSIIIIKNGKLVVTLNQFLSINETSFEYLKLLFSIFSVILISITIIQKTFEDHKASIREIFLKMIDYHRDNVSRIEIKEYKSSKKSVKIGKDAFVPMKLQLFDLLEVVKKINDNCEYEKLDLSRVIDLAYMAFFYGLNDKWNDFIDSVLSMYNDYYKNGLKEKVKLRASEYEICRTNQTALGSYFRNIYNAIKLIDEDVLINNKEKYQLVKILRSQLSNSELLILFYNLESRFGLTWKYSSFVFLGKEIVYKNDIIKKYKLTTNIPENYCHLHDHKKLLNIEYEDDELKRLMIKL